MTGHLGDADLARLARGGVRPLQDAEGLALFDAALAGGRGAVVAAGIDRAGLRAQAGRGTLPHLLRALVPAAGRRRAGAAPAADSSELVRRLAAASEEDRDAILLDLVRAQAATALGHASADRITADRAFRELGFDSLTAVELRNRLQAATGRQLPMTLVFDYPTPTALARFLRQELAPSTGSGPDALLAELERVAAALEAARADDAARVLVADRVRELARRWSGAADDADDAAIETASDDELFSVLDEELGTA
jgi:acyl carrier protein